MKFKNPGEQVVRIAMLTGHVAVFEPGETLEVPEIMKSDCLAANLTLVPETTKKAGARKAPEAVAEPEPEPEATGDDDGDAVINVSDE